MNDMNQIYNIDCMEYMKTMANNSVNLTLTDIPYDGVTRNNNGLRNLDKMNADILTFDLNLFLDEVYRVTNDIVIIFCGKAQFSEIYSYFHDKQERKKGSVRGLVWEKSNPSPMNGKHIYLSGIEMAVWFKKRGSNRFTAFCKNTVFKFPSGSSKFHPTEKNHKLLKELILDNSLDNDIVFDPCAGSGAHLLNAYMLNRQYIGCELNQDYYEKAKTRLNEIQNKTNDLKS